MKEFKCSFNYTYKGESNEKHIPSHPEERYN